jgi:hypothetical protein
LASNFSPFSPTFLYHSISFAQMPLRRVTLPYLIELLHLSSTNTYTHIHTHTNTHTSAACTGARGSIRGWKTCLQVSLKGLFPS